MEFDALEVVRDGPVAGVVLNRPDVRNAMNREMIEELSSAFTALGGDDSVRVVVLSGKGRVFCAGADIAWMRDSADLTAEENRQDAERLAEMLLALDECPKVVIGRVHGAAMGGGLGLLAVCDLVAAARDTRFSFSEARLGILPSVIAPFVTAKIGLGQARRFFLTAELFSSVEGREMGLVNEVVLEEYLDTAVRRWVDNILLNGPHALAEAKTLLRTLPQMKRSETIRHCIETTARVRTSAEGQEGLRAFLEKRTPAWREEE
jgi:methylglutaconyl-CoA hydratase